MVVVVMVLLTRHSSIASRDVVSVQSDKIGMGEEEESQSSVTVKTQKRKDVRDQ